MPRMNDPSMETGTFGGKKGFHFSGTRIDRLGATGYTLVTIAVDVTGSVSDFEKDLKKCLVNAVEGCRKSPHALNLLLRVIFFSGALPGGVQEVHGFKPLQEIVTADYPAINPSGGTPLYDATYSAAGATNAYAKQLTDQDFNVNGIFFIITDGDENASAATLKMVKEEMKQGKNKEIIESVIGIVIGINASYCQAFLDNFAQGADMKYVDAGDSTPQKLAKLAEFVSQSVSSQSQARGTGGPSQNISATI